MKCDNCSEKPATIHVIKLINGHKEEINLCEECAKKMSIPIKNFTIQELLGGMLGGNQVENKPEPGACPTCHFEYSQIQNNGRLGCPDCYTQFRQPLTQVLRRVHGSTTHEGKVPKRTQSALVEVRRLNALRQEMNEAVSTENFERAAQIRDEIKLLQQQGSELL